MSLSFSLLTLTQGDAKAVVGQTARAVARIEGEAQTTLDGMPSMKRPLKVWPRGSSESSLSY